MKKILFISGSQRNGNCKQILEDLQKNFWLETSTEVVFIRDFSLTPCKGCDACKNRENNKCVSDDDMNMLLEKVYDAEIVVLATPNYFYNVSSLTKNFIDRTYPCYFNKKLKDKKFIYIYIGNDDSSNTKKYLDNAMYGFTVCQNIKLLASFALSADEIGEFVSTTERVTTTQNIINIIRQNLN